MKNNELWDISVGAEGRTLSYTYRLKRPIVDMEPFHRLVSGQQKDFYEGRCSEQLFSHIHKGHGAAHFL